jgi:hypothetical protein
LPDTTSGRAEEFCQVESNGLNIARMRVPKMVKNGIYSF